MNEMPPLTEQAKDFVLKEPSPFSHYNAEKKEFLNAQDPFWKQACLDKFRWIKTAMNVDRNLSAADIAKMSEDVMNEVHQNENNVKQNKDTLLVNLRD